MANCQPKESPGPVWSVCAFVLIVVMVAWLIAAVQPYRPVG